VLRVSAKVRAFVALGTNVPHLGAAGPALLKQALAALQAAGLRLRALSSVWETPAWPPDGGQPNYFNAVAELAAEGLSPQPLYEVLRGVEARFGRVRRERWAARTLDLDLLAMDGFSGTFGDLVLPHPRVHERAFVLAPLAELAPHWRHPTLQLSAAEMLAGLSLAGYRRLDRSG